MDTDMQKDSWYRSFRILGSYSCDFTMYNIRRHFALMHAIYPSNLYLASIYTPHRIGVDPFLKFKEFGIVAVAFNGHLLKFDILFTFLTNIIWYVIREKGALILFCRLWRVDLTIHKELYYWLLLACCIKCFCPVCFC